MDKKIAIAAVAVIAVVVIAGVLHSLNKEDDKVVITFDGNGGTFDGNGTLSSGSTIVGDTVPVRQGYDFLSWNTARDGSGDAYSSGDALDRPVTLYAQWGSTMTYIKATDWPRIYDGDDLLGSTKSLPAAG